jgi:chromate transporter
MSQVPLAEALRFWLKLGFVSFGGPAGQIAILHKELVEKRAWISEKRFLHALNYCMLLPGPEAQQLATYLGWLMHRTRGGLAAGVLFIAPSFFILCSLAWLYLVHGETRFVSGLFYGISAAVVAIVLHAAWRIGSRSLHHPLLAGIALAAFVAMYFFDTPFPAIVVTAALIGLVAGRWQPGWFDRPAAHRAGSGSARAALIDDHTPPPAHARFSRVRLARVLAVGALLFALPLGLLLLHGGWSSLPVQLGWFFTKAALLTFGGAYAVLPYVYQGAVEHHGWLTAQQMMAGLALGETTPGPLIMIVTFVGFIAGWGGSADLAFAIVGAAVASWFTFLPSFLFIFAGAPLVESTRGNLRFTAPLAAISAAVVGVIVNLALFFAAHVFVGAGQFAGQIDWVAVAISAGALALLVSGRIGVIGAIGAAAIVGLAITWIK